MTTLNALAQSRALQLAQQIQQGSPLSHAALQQAAKELNVNVADLRSAVDAQLSLLERSSTAVDQAGRRSEALRTSLGSGTYQGQARVDVATSPALRGFNLKVPGEASADSAAPARPTFLERPKADSSENPTWTAMTESWGQTHDLILQGRAVDGDLLNELSRYGVDNAEIRGLVGQLAGAGVISGTAYRQIATNSNFAGSRDPLEERLAFALAVTNHGGDALDRYFKRVVREPDEDVHKTSALARLYDVLGVTEPFDAWKQGLIEQGKALLEATKSGALLTSDVARDVFASRLPDSAPASLKDASAGALIAYDAALRLGAQPDEAASIAARVDAGELDAETLRMLAPRLPDSKLVLLSARRGESAIVGQADLRATVELAGEVARGEISSGQIYGFFMRYGFIDDGSLPRFSLEQVGGILRAVNRGEVDPARLDAVLDPKAYFDSNLMKLVWQRMFSGMHPRGGNKYTVSGVAPDSYVTSPLTLRLDAELVTKLAADDAKLNAFRAAFAKELEDALPSRWQMRKRRDEPGDWEVDLYRGAVERAFARAVRTTGLA